MIFKSHYKHPQFLGGAGYAKHLAQRHTIMQIVCVLDIQLMKMWTWDLCKVRLIQELCLEAATLGVWTLYFQSYFKDTIHKSLLYASYVKYVHEKLE